MKNPSGQPRSQLGARSDAEWVTGRAENELRSIRTAARVVPDLASPADWARNKESSRCKCKIYERCTIVYASITSYVTIHHKKTNLTKFSKICENCEISFDKIFNFDEISKKMTKFESLESCKEM